LRPRNIPPATITYSPDQYYLKHCGNSVVLPSHFSGMLTMRVNIKSLPYRIFIYAIAHLSIAVVNFITTSLIHRISTTSSMLFPVLTISLMGFHIMIACFMGMKYLCDKNSCTWPR
jgi:hypothetical protein